MGDKRLEGSQALRLTVYTSGIKPLGTQQTVCTIYAYLAMGFWRCRVLRYTVYEDGHLYLWDWNVLVDGRGDGGGGGDGGWSSRPSPPGLESCFEEDDGGSLTSKPYLSSTISCSQWTDQEK